MGFAKPAGLRASPIFKPSRKLQDKHARKTDVASEKHDRVEERERESERHAAIFLRL